MLALLPFANLLSFAFICFAYIGVGVAILFPEAWGQLILRIAAAITLVATAFVYIGWKYLWRLTILRRHIYPALHGVWEGHIVFLGASGREQRDVVARIDQTFLSLHIRLESAFSRSETLIAVPTTSPGRKSLTYVYHNTPRASSTAATDHHGSALLEVFDSSLLRLQGNYFNDEGRRGEIHLVRTSTAPHDFDRIRAKRGW